MKKIKIVANTSNKSNDRNKNRTSSNTKEGASSLSGKGQRVPKLSLAGSPKVAPVQVWVALEEETFLGLCGPRLEKTACSLSIFGEIQEFGPCTRHSGS